MQLEGKTIELLNLLNVKMVISFSCDNCLLSIRIYEVQKLFLISSLLVSLPASSTTTPAPGASELQADSQPVPLSALAMLDPLACLPSWGEPSICPLGPFYVSAPFP